MSVEHCPDLPGARRLGEYWEGQFVLLMGQQGLAFTRHQLERNGAAQWTMAPPGSRGPWSSRLLPDITIWSAPGQHHEITHKAPTKRGCYGLEVYRFQALLAFAHETRAAVFYTVHDHSLAGGRDARVNDIAHWCTAEVRALEHTWERLANSATWYGGQPREVPTYYWRVERWRPLAALFDGRIWPGCGGRLVVDGGAAVVQGPLWDGFV